MARKDNVPIALNDRLMAEGMRHGSGYNGQGMGMDDLLRNYGTDANPSKAT